MNHATDKVYLFSLNFVKLITLILTGFLFVGGLLFTCYSNDMTSQVVLTKWDNPLLTIPATILMAGLFLVISSLINRHAKVLKPLLLFAVMGWILLLGAVLIAFSRTVPAADAMSVYSAAQILAVGDTSVIHPTDSYFSYYPQQVGLLAFLETLSRLWNLLGLNLPAYHFMKCIYVVLLTVTVLFQYKSVHLIWQDDRTDCIYLLFAGANLPMIMYSSFVYGEIPSFAVFTIGLYFLLKLLLKAPSISNGAVSLLFLTLSVMLRKNNLILIIAVLLATALQWMKSKKHLLILFTALCACCSLLILPVTERMYEHRADNNLSSGVTAMSYFAMGMQEASRGPGWYNSFNLDTYQSSEMDSEQANEISRQAIRDRLTYFQENPGYALSFYWQKHLSQWADGTYASRQATLATFGGRQPLFQSLYEGKLSTLYINYCNIFQNVIYLGALLFCLRSIRDNKKNPATNTLPVYIGLIGVIGGFLFHIIWEANSRYIFLYSLLLLPYAAKGLIMTIPPLPIRKHT